jgi:hypothetical protein
MTTQIVTEYLHGENDELSELWPPDAPQQEKFHYALYEVEVYLEVDMETGKSRIVSVNGIGLPDPGDFH